MSQDRFISGKARSVDARLRERSGEQAFTGANAVKGKTEPCANCGYDLRATPVQAPCPECGMYRRSTKILIDAPMSAMEIGVIRKFVRGARILAACLAACVVLVVGATKWLGNDNVPWVMAGVSVLWVVGCWGLTPVINSAQGRFHGFSQQGKLRMLARRLQVAWMPAWSLIGIVNAMQVNGLMRSLMAVLVFVLVLVGLTGIVMLCLLMRELAQWVRDDLAEKLLVAAAWAYGLGLPLAVLSGIKLS
ncbi:MAG TPA: hypothetical protein VG711_05545, partial [Phycisphaerales bacterium]|nr:hypothetical protein [Phycisphaerales bacterium]